EDYIEVVATFRGRENPNKESYSGTWFHPQVQSGNDKDAQAKATRLPADGEEANRVVLRGEQGRRRSSRSLPRRSGCSLLCFTTLRNSSGMPIVCSASAPSRPLTSPRLSMSGIN